LKWERTHLKNIFLSGGFAQNEYLFREVTKSAAEDGIEVHRADDCWSGVVKGAILRCVGIGMDALDKAETCPRHYGICTSQEYANWRDGNMRTIADGFDGRRMVPEQLIWLIHKGDIIIPGKLIDSTFDIQCKFTRRHRELGEIVQMIVAATAMERAPSNLSRLQADQNEVVRLDIRLADIPQRHIQVQDRPDGGSPFLKATITVEIQVYKEVVFIFKCGHSVLSRHKMTL